MQPFKILNVRPLVPLKPTAHQIRTHGKPILPENGRLPSLLAGFSIFAIVLRPGKDDGAKTEELFEDLNSSVYARLLATQHQTVGYQIQLFSIENTILGRIRRGHAI